MTGITNRLTGFQSRLLQEIKMRKDKGLWAANLTEDEMLNAAKTLTEFVASMSFAIKEAHEQYYYTQDIKSKVEELYEGNEAENPNFSEEEFETMAFELEQNLSRNDGYWESFWLTVESVIEEAIETKNNEQKEGE